MRNKVIIGILAFVLTFGLAVAITPSGRNRVTRMYQNRIVHVNHDPKGCVEGEQTEVQQKISALLAQDVENGRILSVKRLGFGSEEISRELALEREASLTAEYVSDSSAIDTTGLPQDFQNAWRQHMEAWKSQSESLTAFSKRISTTNKFRQQDKSEIRMRNFDEEISATWANVLCLARKYGAEIPPNA